MAILLRGLHICALGEGQIGHDIVCEPHAPLCEIHGRPPTTGSVFLFGTRGCYWDCDQRRDEDVDLIDNALFDALQPLRR